jgi:hypothetical protein
MGYLTILGVTVIFRVLPSPNEYLLSVVPKIIDPSGLMSLLSQCSTCVSRLKLTGNAKLGSIEDPLVTRCSIVIEPYRHPSVDGVLGAMETTHDED